MGKNKIVYNEKLGKEYGKPDLERLGLFVEMPYMNGKGYVSPFPKPKQVKGLNMVTEGQKSISGPTHGYFDKEYKRLFVGEAKGCSKGTKVYKPDPKRISTAPFNIPGNTKWHSTPGDYYGTFSGKFEAFSNRRWPKKPYKSEPGNFVTRNVKKGGPGYADICLNKYPEHLRDPFRPKPNYKQYGKVLDGPYITSHYTEAYFDKNPYFDKNGFGPMYVQKKQKFQYGPKVLGVFMPTGPAKWKGGCQGGTFHKFPEFMPCKYVNSFDANKPTIKPGGPVFFPQSTASKTMFTTSVLYQNTDLRVNTTNYKTYESSYIKYLLDS